MFVLVLAPACHRWMAPREPLPQAFARDSSQTIRVRKRDGTQYYIHSPRLRNDTLFGAQGEDVHFAIPMKDAASVQVERRDKARTFAFGLGLVVLAGLVFLGIRAIVNDDYDHQ